MPDIANLTVLSTQCCIPLNITGYSFGPQLCYLELTQSFSALMLSFNRVCHVHRNLIPGLIQPHSQGNSLLRILYKALKLQSINMLTAGKINYPQFYESPRDFSVCCFLLVSAYSHREYSAQGSCQDPSADRNSLTRTHSRALSLSLSEQLLCLWYSAPQIDLPKL